MSAALWIQRTHSKLENLSIYIEVQVIDTVQTNVFLDIHFGTGDDCMGQLLLGCQSED